MHSRHSNAKKSHQDITYAAQIKADIVVAVSDNRGPHKLSKVDFINQAPNELISVESSLEPKDANHANE